MKKFAFLTNIIETKDVRLKGFYPILGRVVPLFVWNLVLRYVLGNQHFEFLRKRGYLLIASYDMLGKTKGYTILVLLSSEQMVKHPLYAKRRILDACKFAQDELGVDLIGLGSLTKSVVNDGIWLKKQGIRVSITHGDSYTVAAAVEGISKVAKVENLDTFTVGIAGAYGKVGRAVAEILCIEKKPLVLMGRREHLLNEMKKNEPFRSAQEQKVVFVTSLKEMLDKADIALMATSAPYSIIGPEHLKPKKTYLIYDLGQPHNLSRKQYIQLLNKGFKIKRFDGTIIEPPREVNIGFNMRLRPDRQYACFVEAALQAMEGDNEDHIGRVELNHVLKTNEWARAHGFHHAPPECFLQPLPKS